MAIEVIAEKEDAAEGSTSADAEIKNDAPSSPGHDRKVVTEAATTSSIAVVNDGNTSSADVTVESDGETRKISSILQALI